MSSLPPRLGTRPVSHRGRCRNGRERLHPCRIAIEVERAIENDGSGGVKNSWPVPRPSASHSRRWVCPSATCPASTVAILVSQFPDPMAVRHTAHVPLNHRGPRNVRSSAATCSDVRQLASFSPAHCRGLGSKRHASGRSTIPSTAPSRRRRPYGQPRATRARSASLKARLSTRCPSAFDGGDRQIRLRIPGRGNRRAARDAHGRRTDRNAVEVRRIALREHHALPPTARTADKVASDRRARP